MEYEKFVEYGEVTHPRQIGPDAPIHKSQLVLGLFSKSMVSGSITASYILYHPKEDWVYTTHLPCFHAV